MKDIIKKKSLSVCFFSHSSQLGGAERCLLELTTELVRDYGVICTVILPSDGSLKKELEKMGVSTLIINYSWWCNINIQSDKEIGTQFSISTNKVLEAMADLNKINPDIIITNTLVIPWGALAAYFLQKPHVWYIHEFGELEHGLKFYLPFKRILEIITDSSNLIFTCSNAVRKKLFGNSSKKNILTIHSYIDIPSNALQTKTNYFKRTNATKLIITGHITKSKGQKDAILAIRELLQRKKNIELIIMGIADMEYLIELRKIVEDGNLSEYIQFLDYKENPYDVVNQADIVLVCSRIEAFGLVTLEAMFMKKPVIGTNSGGTPEQIREGFNGLLYEPENYYQLANKIEYLIDHRREIKRLGKNGYTSIKKNLTKEKYGKKVYEQFKRLRNTKNLPSIPFNQFVIYLINITIQEENRELKYIKSTFSYKVYKKMKEFIRNIGISKAK